MSIFDKSISYDRDAREFRATLDGNFIGYFGSYHAAEIALDQVAYDLLADGLAYTAAELDSSGNPPEGPPIILIEAPDTTPPESVLT